jgi:hypothetical protein
MSLEKRIKTLAVQIHPFRDVNCLQKKMQDQALQAKFIKMLNAYTEGKRYENAIDEIQKIEELVKETRS